MSYTRRKFSEAYALQHADTGNNRFGTYNFTDDEIVRYTTIDYCPGLITKYAEYAVKYHSDRDVIAIYFQGSADFGDWSANLTTSTKDWRTVTFNGSKVKIKVHKGWYNMYNAMKSAVHKEYEVLKKAHANAELEIIGHSLGAGMAQICAEEMYNSYGVKSHCFTFGSVKPFYFESGDVKGYLQSCCKEVYNFCDSSDIVCYLPPFNKFDHINAVWVDYANSGLDYKIDNVFSYHFVYDIEALYEATGVYEDGVPTLEANKVTY